MTAAFCCCVGCPVLVKVEVHCRKCGASARSEERPHNRIRDAKAAAQEAM